eukprot:SAG11_NODE_737_length_7431_cov_7.438762_9_plen_144_part_00
MLAELLPEEKSKLDPPKAARSAYHFFDKAQRSTLDNDALFLQARADPVRVHPIASRICPHVQPEGLARPTLKQLKTVVPLQARPKLSTMQNRALEEMWEFSTAMQRTPYEQKAMADIERFEAETAQYEIYLGELQVRSGHTQL